MARLNESSSRARATNYAFVNYTDMDSMHDSSTYTQIRKHAMRQVGAAKRKPRGRNKTMVELFWVPIAPDESSQTQELPTTAAPASTHAASETQVREGRFTDDKALYNSFVRSISCKSDPFGTAAVSVDPLTRELLQYFMFHASRQPNTWTYPCSSPLLPNTPSEHKYAICRTIGSALQDPLLGNGLLAAAASRVCNVDGATYPMLREKESHFTHQTIQILRTRLEESLDACTDSIEALVRSMLHLGSASFYREDITTATLHIRAAITLSDRIGGAMALRDPYTRGRIIVSDDLVSCMELRPCMLKDNYDPGPLSLHSNQGMKSCADDRSSSEADLLTKSPLLPPELQELLLQIMEWHHARCHLQRSESALTFADLADLQWLTMRLLAIRNRLLVFGTSDNPTNILRVVLLLWTLLPWSGDLKEATIVNAIAPKLQNLLQQSLRFDKSAWTGCENVQLWCLLMGYTSAQEGDHVQLWFAKEIQLRLRDERIDLPAETSLLKRLIGFQQQFIYHAAVQEPVTIKLSEWLLEERRAM